MLQSRPLPWGQLGEEITYSDTGVAVEISGPVVASTGGVYSRRVRKS